MIAGDTTDDDSLFDQATIKIIFAKTQEYQCWFKKDDKKRDNGVSPCYGQTLIRQHSRSTCI